MPLETITSSTILPTPSPSPKPSETKSIKKLTKPKNVIKHKKAEKDENQRKKEVVSISCYYQYLR